MAGPLDDVISMLGSGTPAPTSGGSASPAGYLNDPKNRPAIMADAERIAALRPGNSAAPKGAVVAKASRGPLDDVIGMLSGDAGTSGATATTAPAIPKPAVSDVPQLGSDGHVLRDARPAPAPEPGFFDKVKGAGEAALQFASAIPATIPASIAAISQMVGGQEKYGSRGMADAAERRFTQTMGDATYSPKTATGQQYSEGLNNALERSGVQGLPIPMMNDLGAVLRPATAMARQGVSGATNQLTARLGGAGAADAGAIARIEPTLAKPRVKLNVDGSKTVVQPSQAPAQATPQAPAVGRSPVTEPQQMPTVPTLADATPELQNAISNMSAKGRPVDPTVLQRHVEADTLPVPVKLTAGQATLDPAVISDEMNGRGKVRPTVSPDFYNAQGKALGANLEAIRSSIAPEVTEAHPTAHGQALVDAYKSMDAPAREAISAKYQALKDANGGDFPVAGQDIAAAADHGLKSENVTRFLPSEVKGILDDIRQPGNMTFNDFQNYLTILGQQERKAARAGDGTAGHAIGVVRSAFESLPMSEEAAHLKPLLDSARGAAKERFDKIASDPAYKAAIADDTPIGEPSPLADKFVSGYVTGNNVRGANLAQMKANLAEQAGAHQTIAAATLDHLKGLAKVDPETGKFLSDGYGKAVSQLSMKLPDMVGPNAAQQLQQVAKVAKYTSAQPKGSYVNNANSLVSALSAPAAAGLRSLLAVKTMGASEAALSGLGAVKHGKAGQRAVSPAAGVNRLTNTPP